MCRPLLPATHMVGPWRRARGHNLWWCVSGHTRCDVRRVVDLIINPTSLPPYLNK